MDIAHQKAMDRVYRHMKHVYDATRPFFLAGRRRLRQHAISGDGKRILEVGCGTARNLILLARAMPEAHFTGIDISSEMCRYAREQVARHGLSDRIEIFEGELADFVASTKAADYAEPFDTVLFSFSLSMIPDWWEVLEAAFEIVAADGGRILIADFGPCQAWPSLARWRLYKNLTYFHVFPRPDLPERLDGLAGVILREERLLGGYGMVLDVVVPPACHAATQSDASFPNTKRVATS
jgi:S-adenosylmethionine-diacylgycerolhomoserine-N-methlytransferase